MGLEASLAQSLQSAISIGTAFAILLAAGCGLATSLSPGCIANASLLVALASGTPEPSAAKSFGLSMVFAIGNTITFVALGIIAATLGSFFSIPIKPLLLGIGALLVFMALQTLGIVNILPNSSFMEKHLFKGHAGAFAAGLCSGLFSAPCCMPIVIVLVTFSATSGNLIEGVMLMLAYALSHNVLVIVAGTSFGFAQSMLHSSKVKHASTALRGLIATLFLLIGIFLLIRGALIHI